MADNKLRVAAYCRVSTLTDTQDGSFEVQCKYFEKRIKEDPDMEFVGIYGDQGKSGRAMRGRKELNRMIKDCEAGKIDVILTKSISRFARNMLECVETIRHLKEYGVSMRFEKENIDTDTMGGELMLSILATIAQEESNSISQNMIWSRIRHVEKGQPWEKARYGYLSVGPDHVWEIVDKEAAVVRQAFYMAGMCCTYKEILAKMNRMEEENGSGRVWKGTPLVNLLRSEVYIGNYLSKKEITIVDRKGIVKRVRNRGEMEQILVEEHHEPIVSKELYMIVQELLDYRSLGSRRKHFGPEEEKIREEARRIAGREAEFWGQKK